MSLSSGEKAYGILAITTQNCSVYPLFSFSHQPFFTLRGIL